MRDRLTLLRGPNRWFRQQACEVALEPASDPTDLERLLDAAVAWQAQVLDEPAAPTARHAVEPGIGAFGCEHEALAAACLDTARDHLAAIDAGQPFDVAARCIALRTLARQVRLGPSTTAIVAAARARGIPARRLGSGSLVVLGQGASQRRIWAAETDRTSAIAQGIAQDKQLTRELLEAAGVPVPAGGVATTPGEAWSLAQALGGPVVVKPRDGNQGRGVSGPVEDHAAILAGFAQASQHGAGVVVERWVRGHDFRLLVVDGRMIAAARRDPPRVRADGIQSIAQLVATLNADPRRAPDHAGSLSPVDLDDPLTRACLENQGLDPASVPSPGTFVRLRANANLSTGGTAADVTDRVHPSIIRHALRAAAMVGLDVAGIDLIAHDIGRPLEDQRGAVIEVNAGPGLRMHLDPAEGRPRPVAAAIIDSLFPPGATGRIPVVGITGVNGKTTTTRLIAGILARAGLRVGMTCTDGIAIDGQPIATGDCSGPRSARDVLLDPAVEAAVLETARGGILREGLGFDHCQVAVVTNIGEGDHLGQAGIRTPADLARVKRVLVEAVSPGGFAVLNAADPLVVAMADFSPGGVVWFARGELPRLAAHRQAGGRAVFLRDDRVILARGPLEQDLLPIDAVPLTLGGRVGFHVENVLAAAAAAWVLDIPLPHIRQALEAFPAGPAGSPGRFNLIDHRGVTVVVDYVHNPSGVAALVDSLDAFPHACRTIVYSAVGDRRNADIIRQGALLGAGFDRVVLYEDGYNRGRPSGQVIGLLRQGLASGSRAVEVHELQGGLNACRFALEQSQPGDLLVVQPNDIDETLAFFQAHQPPVFHKAHAPHAAALTSPPHARPGVHPISRPVPGRLP